MIHGDVRALEIVGKPGKNPLSARILLVEDNEDDAALTQRRLAAVAPSRYQVTWVQSAAEGLQLAQNRVFDVCLVDYRLGESNGLQFINNFRASGAITPCIFLTGGGNAHLDLEAMQVGAVDYLNKNDLSDEVLERSIRYAVERGRCEHALAQAARRDPLTRLHNRASLYERLDAAIERYQRTDRRIAVLAIDLDRFKPINDSIGHHAGDTVLRMVSDRLLQVVRPYDLVARVGGDEFVIVIDEFLDPSEASRESTVRDAAEEMDWLASLADRVFAKVSAPIRIEDQTVAVTASVGIACCPDDSVDVDGLLKAADRAMYRAKHQRLRTAFYDAEIDGNASAAQRAPQRQVAGGFLDLAFQPQVELKTGRIRACEALLRWTTSSGRKLTPAECLPVFRRQGILGLVGDSLRERAAAQAHAWRQRGLAAGSIAVNVSASELCEPALASTVEQLLDRYAISLEIELTESELVHDDLRARSALARLRALGVRIVIDDFGAGFFSLQRLRAIPFDVLKIDRMFIANVAYSSHDRAIIEAMVALTDRLGVKLVAEGIESDEQRRVLIDLGVQYGQGFMLCNPLAAHDFEEWYFDHQESKLAPAASISQAG